MRKVSQPIENKKIANLIKRILKITFINFVFIFLILILFEFLLIIIDYPSEKRIQELGYKFDNQNKEYTFITYLAKQLQKPPHKIIYVTTDEIRGASYPDNELLNPKKSSIILFGCSYTYGHHLEEKYAFHSILSKYTKRIVFNLGVCGGSPREILFLLRDKEIINKTIKDKNIEYVIYTYIYDHKRRLYTDIRIYVPHFRKIDKGHSLEFTKNSYFYRTHIYRNIGNFIFTNFIENKTEYNLLKLYIEEINKEIKKLYGNNTKFVILLYDCSESDIQFFDDLSKEGIIIINLEKMLNINLQDEAYIISKDDDHPNAKAWEVIVPALAKELNL